MNWIALPFISLIPGALLLISLLGRAEYRDYIIRRSIRKRLIHIASGKICDQYCRCRYCKPPLGQTIYLTAWIGYAIAIVIATLVGVIVYYYATGG
jgi:hypothetical protein